MENQHRIITGYRDLLPHEIALLNRIKAEAIDTALLIEEVKEHIGAQKRGAAGLPPPEGVKELDRLRAAEPERWVAIAKTHFQEAYMALARAVAQPTTF